ncbi:MAG: helix-turn-helix domain-containing protein [Eubacterium sp.]|nr:helix-turn-helix domain-containing protein [Eubacterium sp.]MCM1216752.1 helix-turn-helix domain-containing protein [Lachnospiraceae bacterium]MCM1238800.1 helix-turn-helix domain-containing protein [Lachnospiraceae bacterium]
MDRNKTGNFIAARRKAQGMTQVQFAEKLGVTNKAVSKWETGRCLPDTALIDDICFLLDITAAEFFAGEKLAELSSETADGKPDFKRSRLLKPAKIISLAALAVSLLCTVDLGINYANALLVDYHDGIVLTGVLGRFLYGDRGWSLPAFFQSFHRMLVITAVLAVENIVLQCVSIAKSERT